MIGNRCTVCKGPLEFSFITSSGINVYRCTRDNTIDERLFIVTSAGPIEVRAKSRRKGKSVEWDYEVIDIEKMKKLQEERRVQKEIEERTLSFNRSREEIEQKVKYREAYGEPEE